MRFHWRAISQNRQEDENLNKREGKQRPKDRLLHTQMRWGRGHELVNKFREVHEGEKGQKKN